MGANESSQAEGQFDGRPSVLNYKRGETEDECSFSYADGDQVCPTTKWTHIPLKSILGEAPVSKETAEGSYQFLYVEDNVNVEKDTTVSPVLLKSASLRNPPDNFVHDLKLPPEAARPETRQDPATWFPNLHVVLSTHSGTGRAEDVYKRLVKPVLDHFNYIENRHYEVHVTSSETSIIELARYVLLPHANLGVLQSVLLMSGDGGPLDIINTLLSAARSPNYRKPNIALIPLGTGNALANSAGINADNTLGMRTWMRGSPKEIPLFTTTFSAGARILFDEARQERPLHSANGVPTAHGAVVCSWGLHAGLVADSDTAEYRRFGAERFKMAAQEALHPADGSPAHVYQGKVSVIRPGGEEWQALEGTEHAYVLLTPLSQLEKGFTISPEARPLEGKLRLVHFGPVDGEGFMEIMGKAYQGGKHVSDERVRYEEVEGLRIEFLEDEPRWRRVCLDGQIIRVEQGGFVEIRACQKGVVDLIVQ